MTGYSGLSQLADAARDLTQPREAAYPVKRKGERRRLNPNRDGIAWLEGEAFHSNTEIIGVKAGEDGVTYITSAGAVAATLHVRPMFQVFKDGGAYMFRHFSCPDCDDWSRTSRCDRHHDRDGVRGLVLGASRGVVLRRERREHDTDTAALFTARLVGLIDMISPSLPSGNMAIEVQIEPLQSDDRLLRRRITEP